MVSRYLKPCPFCGCQMYVHKIDYPNGDVGYQIGGWHDSDCYMEHCHPHFETANEAIEAWNRRDENEV